MTVWNQACTITRGRNDAKPTTDHAAGGARPRPGCRTGCHGRGAARAGRDGGSHSARSASSTAAPAPAKLTNLAHLNFLLDDVPLLAGVAGHTTYRAAEEPTARAPWVYADRQADGSFHRVGGGPITDAARGWYAQGAYDADDISRAAVVYLRDWKQNGTASSRTTRLRAAPLAHLPADRRRSERRQRGALAAARRDAEPLGHPEGAARTRPIRPSRSGWPAPSGRSARATPVSTPPTRRSRRSSAAAHATSRCGALSANRSRSTRRRQVANGVTVPGWLIVGSAGATAEAVLGLSAYTARAAGRRRGTDRARALRGRHREAPERRRRPVAVRRAAARGELPHVLARLGAGCSPPRSRAAATCSVTAACRRRPPPTSPSSPRSCSRPAARTTAGRRPRPTARRSPTASTPASRACVAASDATGAAGLATLAGAQAAWYFGANRAGAPAYDPATGVCVDGIAPDGTVNRNCGAESVIHTAAEHARSGCAPGDRPPRHLPHPHHRHRRAHRRRSGERNHDRTRHHGDPAVGLDRFRQLVGRRVPAGGRRLDRHDRRCPAATPSRASCRIADLGPGDAGPERRDDELDRLRAAGCPSLSVAPTTCAPAPRASPRARSSCSRRPSPSRFPRRRRP